MINTFIEKGGMEQFSICFPIKTPRGQAQNVETGVHIQQLVVRGPEIEIRSLESPGERVRKRVALVIVITMPSI